VLATGALLARLASCRQSEPSRALLDVSQVNSHRRGGPVRIFGTDGCHDARMILGTLGDDVWISGNTTITSS
jgi:hypothetical protein